MPINPCINATVGDKPTQFSCKCTIQHRTFMVRCNNLQCGKMMRYYHNVFGGGFHQTLLDEIQTEVVHLIEFLCLEQFAIIHYLPKVVHALPHKILVRWRYSRPQSAHDKVGIINPHYLILIISYIVLEQPFPLQSLVHYITIIVILMVSGHNEHLTIIRRCPFPKVSQRRDLVFQIEYISGKNQNIARRRQFIMLQPPAVVAELQMQVTHILYLHNLFMLLTFCVNQFIIL